MTDRTLSAALLVALVFALVLPGYSQSNTPQTTTTQKSPHAAATASPVAKAVEMNMAEVEAGKMASMKAENARVKEFAEMMVKEHTAALNQLRTLPGAPSDMKPNAKHQQTADRLSKLSGAAFDREYMRMMVSDHQEALKFFEQHGGQAHATTPPNTAGTTDFASMAQELAPVVRQHLQSAQEIQKELQSGSKPTKQTSTPHPDRSKPTPDPDQK
jgi:putative membrane protein